MSADTIKLSPELESYYADRKLMWRNMALIMTANAGWAVSFAFLNPLMLLWMNNHGIGEKTCGMMLAGNSWAVSFLVMYFGWKSDNFKSRWGRRLPFLLACVPFIIFSIILFPLFVLIPMLVFLFIMQLLASDVKRSILPLLTIDCVPKKLLARMIGLNLMSSGLVGFLGIRYGVKLADVAEWLPYLLGAVILCVTTWAASFIKEPPVKVAENPGTFKPWSALQVGWKDKRNIVMMLGVGSIHSFMVLYETWVWLYAKNSLGFSRGDCAEKLSWSPLIVAVMALPIGWLIDRIGSNKVVIVFWLMELVAFFLFLQVGSLNGLLALAIMMSFVNPLYNGADVMVYKSAHPSVIGSITSSNSFLRNMYIGLLIFLSGLLIEKTGSYKAAFLMGIILSTAGLFLLGVYNYLIRIGNRQEAAAAVEAEKIS